MSFLGPMLAGPLNTALSNEAKDFRDQKLIGDLIAPRVPVGKQSYQYVVFNQDDFRLPLTTLRAPGAEPTSIRTTFAVAPYFCRSHALQGDIPYETEAYTLGFGFSARKRLTKSLASRLNLFREAEIAAAALSTDNFPNGTALSDGALWDSYITTPADDTYETVTSHPITDVETGKEALRQVGIDDSEMVLILSSPVVRVLVNHPDVVHRFQFTNALGIIDIEKLSSVFGCKCVRAGGVQLSQNNVKSWVWGNNAFLGYAQSAPSMNDLSCLKTFSWTGEEDGGVEKGLIAKGAEGFAVQEWPDPVMSKKTWWQSADWYYDIQVVAPETGYPILNAVSGDTMEMVAGADQDD